VSVKTKHCRSEVLCLASVQALEGLEFIWTRIGNCSRSALFSLKWVDVYFEATRIWADSSLACWLNFNESSIPCLVLRLKWVFYSQIKVSVAGALSGDNDSQDTGSILECLREETSTGDADWPSLETIWHDLALLLLGVHHESFQFRINTNVCDYI